MIPLQKNNWHSVCGKRRGPKEWPYAPAFVDLILERVAMGASLEEVCITPHFTGRWVIRRWRKEHPEFNDSLIRARGFRPKYYWELAYEIVAERMNPYCGRGSRLARLKWLGRVRANYKTFGHG